MASIRRHLYEFGAFQLSATENLLRRRGEVLWLTPKALDLLSALVRSSGRILTKEELLSTVWAGLLVDPSNLPTQIGALRKAIGNGYIETVPRRGYRFTAEVTELWEDDIGSSVDSGAESGKLDVALNAEEPVELAAPPDGKPWRRYLTAIWAAIAALVIAFLGATSLSRGRHAGAIQSICRTGRLFAKATSEGASGARVKLERLPQELLVSPDGRKVYSIDDTSSTITVLDGSSCRVTNVITLPAAIHCATMTRDGKRLYAGSKVDGVMEVDTERDRVLERIIPTGGPVYSLAVSAHGEKLFAAMASAGLRVVYVGTGESKLLSGVACPIFLRIDPDGRELYVSYQCGGPGGRSGHDAVEIYDVDSERPLATLNGHPLVGGVLSFAPNGSWAFLYGADACSSLQYDHAGCPVVPSVVYHLLRTKDHKILKTIGMPGSPGAGVFTPDSGRIVLPGDSLSVMDPLKGTVSERFDRPGESYRRIVFSAAGDRAIVPVDPAGILVLDSMDPECLPTTEGLFNLYSGDGTFDDDRQVNLLTPEGGLDFAPGLIGRAFHFNGRDALLHVRSSGACGGCGESWSESLYVKFDGLQREMTILERLEVEGDPAIRLYRSANSRIVLEVGGSDVKMPSVSSAAPVSDGSWHHLALVTHNGTRSLYLDGNLVGQVQTAPIRLDISRKFPGGAFIGASRDRTRLMSGLVDEVAFYNRALNAEEIKGLYDFIGHPMCGSGLNHTSVSQSPGSAPGAHASPTRIAAPTFQASTR